MDEGMKNYGLLFVFVVSIAIIALALVFSILQDASSDLLPGNIAGEAKRIPPSLSCQYDLALAKQRIVKLEYENQVLRERLGGR